MKIISYIISIYFYFGLQPLSIAADIQTQIKQLLPNTVIDQVTESPITGVYQVRTANQIYYFSPQDELFIFGEVYNAAGESLTQRERNKLDLMYLRENQHLAIQIGDTQAANTIYEFIAPDCSYCLRYEDYINKAPNVKRYVFFYDRGTGGDAHRFAHVFCSKDKISALEQVFDLQYKPLKQCEDAEQAFIEHQRIAKRLGVQGTPTLFVNGGRIGGFSPAAIEKLLIQE